MPQGVVQWCDPLSGLGMVREDSSDVDVSAERLAVHGGWPLVAGERVMFDLTVDADGMRADNVRRIGLGGAHEVAA
ncbi:cold shock domain-containing protein [Streptomyces sp. RerS4]|uniref:cold shock domain-containing protein n=1 Tax=Streptomyces sp. RerS4 TaxID=2942449 RepID=UPI00201CACF8|nr:cold shock domain-containing protein [Streptomyces sp. RerS4]UQW99197.1 cold shock domain-containing protein [Streptomyces sp. RerS4]